jgi:hypothetical protein
MIPEAQVQSDWDETDPSDPSYIQNKPNLDIYVTQDELATSVSGFATHVEVYDSMVSAINVATGLIPEGSFIAEVHVTPYSEIKAAYDAGYAIYAVQHTETSDKIYNLEYHVDQIAGGGAEFKFTNIDGGTLYTAHCYEQPAGHSSTGWNTDGPIYIPAAQVQTDWNATWGMASILNKPDLSIYATDSEVQESIVSAIDFVTGIIPSAQVQSDWTESNPASASYIQNKPDEYGLVAGEHITLAVSGDNVIINSDDQTEIFNYGTSTLSEIGAAVNEGKTVMVGRSAYGVDYYGKLDKYQSGAYSFTYLDGNTLVTMKIEPDGGDGTWSMTSTPIQSGYTAGRGINISNNVISADPDNTTIGWDTNDMLSVMRPVPPPRMPLDVGKVLTVDANGDAQWASASGSTYTAGDHIDISNDTISVTGITELVAGNAINITASGASAIISSTGETQVQSDWSVTDTSSKAYIRNKPTIPASPVQSDWNVTSTSSLAFIKNKPTIHTYTGSDGISISNDVVSLSDPVNLIAGSNINISVDGVSAVISSTGGGGGSSYSAGSGIDITNDTISVKSGSGLYTDTNDILKVKTGAGIYIDANGGVAATAATVETIVIDYGEMTAANTTLFDTVFDALEGGKRVLFTQWNNTSNRDTAVGSATEWTDTAPYSITFKMQFYNGTYLNTDTVVWTRGSAATRSSSSARFNFQNAGDGLQTTSASNGTMSAKLGNGLQFDANQAIEINIGDISSVQMVTALPQNPSSTVLYLIPET